MNHLYLSWTQFLWGRVFVTYAFYFTALFGGAESIGLLRLCAYRLGRRLGFDPRGLRPSRDPRQVFAEFLLETSCAAAVHAIVRLDDGSVEGHFCFETASCVGEDRLCYGRFEEAVCLKTRMLLRSTFDGNPLLPEDAFCILSAENSATFSGKHVRVSVSKYDTLLLTDFLTHYVTLRSTPTPTGARICKARAHKFAGLASSRLSTTTWAFVGLPWPSRLLNVPTS